MVSPKMYREYQIIIHFYLKPHLTVDCLPCCWICWKICQIGKICTKGYCQNLCYGRYAVPDHCWSSFDILIIYLDFFTLL